MWVLSQARFFIDPHKMPESTLTVVAQWDCRVNINQQEQWLIDPLLPYSPPHHHVLLPCPTSPLPATSVDFIPCIFSANVSKLDQKPVGMSLQFTHCIKMYLGLSWVRLLALTLKPHYANHVFWTTEMPLYYLYLLFNSLVCLVSCAHTRCIPYDSSA